MTNTQMRPIPPRTQRWFAIVALLAVFIATLGSTASSLHRAYIDSALLTWKEGSVSVIVAAVNIETALDAIASVNGQVTSHLWLINAAGATLSRTQLAHLAAYPGVNSIMPNSSITTAQAPDCSDDPDNLCDGWMTTRRRVLDSYDLGEKPLTSAIFLPDGGVFSIGEKGQAVIINADNTLRAQITLPNDTYHTMPVVGADSTIYLASNNQKVYAVGG